MPGEVTFRVPSLSLGDEAIELFADRPAGPGRTSSDRRRISARWPRSAGAWTGCRWRSSWRRRGCGRCRWTRSSPACTTASGCSPAARVPRYVGSRRCGRRWTGRTRCDRTGASAVSPVGRVHGRIRPRRGASRRRDERRGALSSAGPVDSAGGQVAGRRRKHRTAERDIDCWRRCGSTRSRSSASRARPTMCGRVIAITS